MKLQKIKEIFKKKTNPFQKKKKKKRKQSK